MTELYIMNNSSKRKNVVFLMDRMRIYPNVKLYSKERHLWNIVYDENKNVPILQHVIYLNLRTSITSFYKNKPKSFCIRGVLTNGMRFRLRVKNTYDDMNSLLASIETGLPFWRYSKSAIFNVSLE